MFTESPLAHVGHSPESAAAAGIETIVGRAQHSDVARAATDELAGGLLVLTVDASNGQTIGCSIVGPLADELIATATTFVHLQATLDDLRGLVFAFPTVSQVLEVAIDNAIEALAEYRPHDPKGNRMNTNSNPNTGDSEPHGEGRTSENSVTAGDLREVLPETAEEVAEAQETLEQITDSPHRTVET